MQNKSFLNSLIQWIRVFYTTGRKHTVKTMLHGLFWLIPIGAVFAIFFWVWKQADIVAGKILVTVGLPPEEYSYIWTVLGILLLAISAYLIGFFIQTNIGSWFKHYLEDILTRLPFYDTIRSIVDVIKGGDKKVLIVQIRGFSRTGFNMGLMYSKKESYTKGHYTVILPTSPFPNGGFMFDEPADEIWVIKEASFDSYFTYLLAMGVKSFPEMLGVKPKPISDIPTFKECYLNEEK